MRLYVPPLHSELTLSADWSFKLYNEHRNSSLYEPLDVVYPKRSSWSWDNDFVVVSLPAGTRLKIDRIYIRNGQNDFDSITFSITAARAQQMTWNRPLAPGGIRFWVKLDDANTLQFEEDSVATSEQCAFGKVLQRALNKKIATVNALTITSSMILEQVAAGPELINFWTLDLDVVNVEHLATALRTVFTGQHRVQGFYHALQFCRLRAIERGLDPADLLYGLI